MARLTDRLLSFVCLVKDLTVRVLPGEQTPALGADQSRAGLCPHPGALVNCDLDLVQNFLTARQAGLVRGVVGQLLLDSVTEILPADAGHDSSLRLHGDGVAGPGDLNRVVNTAQQDTLGVTLADHGCNGKYDFVAILLTDFRSQG